MLVHFMAKQVNQRHCDTTKNSWLSDLKGLVGSLNLKGLVLVRSETQSLISNYLIRVKFPP